MITTLGQYLGGKVVTAILVVSGASALIYFWRNPDDLKSIWHVIKYAIVWLGFVVVLPWATFFVTPWVVRQESNTAAGVMLFGYSLLDAMVAFFLIGGLPRNVLSWGVVLLGFLSAAVYNLKVCEYQAERAEGGF